MIRKCIEKMGSLRMILVTSLLAGSQLLMAQKVDLNDLNDQVDDASQTIFDIVGTVIIIGLAVGLIIVINKMIKEPEQGKTYAIAWVVALIVYIIGFQVLGIN